MLDQTKKPALTGFFSAYSVLRNAAFARCGSFAMAANPGYGHTQVSAAARFARAVGMLTKLWSGTQIQPPVHRQTA